MLKVLCVVLMLGLALGTAPSPARAQASSSSPDTSGSWTNLGEVTLKGKMGIVDEDIDAVQVREIHLSYPDSSSYRISKITIWHGPDRRPWLDFVDVDPHPKNARVFHLLKPVQARKIMVTYSNLIKVDPIDVQIMAR